MVHLKRKIPFYQQLDLVDCGPACLQMIAKYYGRSYTLSELRDKAFVDKNGATILGLSETANSIGLSNIVVRLPFDSLKASQEFPCVVHWKNRHYIIVRKITKTKVYAIDPSFGRITYSIDEFVKGWTNSDDINTPGVVMFLEHSEDIIPPTDDGRAFETIRSLYKEYVQPQRWLFVKILACLLIASCFQVVLPLTTKTLVDQGIGNHDIQLIYVLLIGLVALQVGRTFVDFYRRWILLQLSKRMAISVISDFVQRLFALPISFFERRMIGDIIRRIDDYSRIERFVSTSSLGILFSIVNLVVFGAILASYNLVILVIFLAGSGLYITFVSYFMKYRSELDYKAFQRLSANQTGIIQSIQGMVEVKMNDASERKRREWENNQNAIYDVKFESTRLQQVQDTGSLFFNEIKNTVIIFWAAIAVSNGTLTLGTMVAIQFIIGQLSAPIADIVNFMREWQDAKLSLLRINEFRKYEQEDQSSSSAMSPPPPAGDIIINNLSFSYQKGEGPSVIDNLSLTIPRGKTTAIVGASGSGKTTLMKLLLKLYEPGAGSINIGGLDLNNIDTKLWRKRCGCVMQDGFLFSDTIANNVALSSERIDRKRLEFAADIACLTEFVNELPAKYDTRITWNGGGLSQGQKQRILIARAVYKDPEMFFLDEATNALDSINESRILDNLYDFLKKKTVVVIAHRLSTVYNADQILVMKHGQLVERGTHEELLQNRDEYSQLVKNQLKSQVHTL